MILYEGVYAFLRSKKRGLSDREVAVTELMIERLSNKDMLERLKEKGFNFSMGTLARTKRDIKKNHYDRLTYIAGFGFEKQHLERIDTIEYLARLFWQQFHAEDRAFQKAMILKEIRDLQPLIAASYDSTRAIMKKRRKPTEDGQQENEPQEVDQSR